MTAGETPALRSRSDQRRKTGSARWAAIASMACKISEITTSSPTTVFTIRW